MAVVTKEQLEAAKKQNAVEQKKARQKIIPKGFNVLLFSKVEFKMSKSNYPMFVLTFKKANDKNEDFRESSEYLAITPSGVETDFGMNLNLYTAIAFIKNAFGYELEELDEDDAYGDLLKKLKSFEGKSFRGIIQHRLESTSSGSMITRPSLLWRYVGRIDDPSINEKTLPESALYKNAVKKNYTPAPTENNDAPDIPDATEKVPF